MINKNKAGALAALLAGCAFSLPFPGYAQVTEQEARDIASEIYVYLYPLVLGDLARRQATNVDVADKPGFAPANTFQHTRCYQDVLAKPGGRANLDMLPTAAWLDVAREPLALTVPDAGSRHVFFTFQNAWSDAFLTLGPRTGTGRAATYVLANPAWKGKTPKDTIRVDVPSDRIRVSGFVQAKGAEDCTAANAVQDGYQAVPLSLWQKAQKPAKPTKFKPDPKVDMAVPAVDQVAAMPAGDYFKAGLELLKAQKANPTDGTLLLRLQKLGIDPQGKFDFEKLDMASKMALTEAAANGPKLIQWRSGVALRGNKGWVQGSDYSGAQGNAYLKRAALAYSGAPAITVEDALVFGTSVDADGYPLTGEKRYTIRIKKGELPPAVAYWSLTLYDAAGSIVANKLNRIMFTSDSPLKADKDGSIDLYLQFDSPGAAREGNWLPVPKAPFNLVLRLYAPAASALDGSWTPPGVERVKDSYRFGD